MTRFLSAALLTPRTHVAPLRVLVAPAAPRPRTDAERAYAAAVLAGAFRAEVAGAHADELRRAGRAAATALIEAHPITDAVDELCVDYGALVRGRIVAEVPAADRTAVAVAVVRSLLGDAPECCEALDRAVKAAAQAEGHAVTEAHEAMAAEVLR